MELASGLATRLGACTCGEVSFDQADLLRILRAGGIPGISGKGDARQQYFYEIVDITGRNYTAISHVWSHGLGNSSSNSLSLCRLLHLLQLIGGVSCHDSLLWIDSISVPVDPECKKLALPKLRQVCQQANEVLVIDCHLLQGGTGTGLLERRIYLRTSGWMTRLWTLQEGRLAQGNVHQNYV